jgi:hypothetical protein
MAPGPLGVDPVADTMTASARFSPRTMDSFTFTKRSFMLFPPLVVSISSAETFAFIISYNGEKTTELFRNFSF